MSVTDQPDPAAIMDNVINDGQTMQYIDLTPTWTAVVPILVAGLRSTESNYAAIMVEIYRMAELADLANKWLPKFVAQGDVAAAGALVKQHRRWVELRTEYENDRSAMIGRINRMDKAVGT
jgi:hypothetical protein